MGPVTKNMNSLARPGVVIDTCIYLDAMIGQVYPEAANSRNGLCFDALKLATRTHDLCFTEATMEEAFFMIAHMKRDYMQGDQRNAARLAFVLEHIDPYARNVMPVQSGLICSDPKDQMFIEAAAGAQARYLISGNRDLLRLKYDGFCQIIKPSEFYQAVISHQNKVRYLNRQLKKRSRKPSAQAAIQKQPL